MTRPRCRRGCRFVDTAALRPPASQPGVEALGAVVVDAVAGDGHAVGVRATDVDAELAAATDVAAAQLAAGGALEADDRAVGVADATTSRMRAWSAPEATWMPPDCGPLAAWRRVRSLMVTLSAVMRQPVAADGDLDGLAGRRAAEDDVARPVEPELTGGGGDPGADLALGHAVDEHLLRPRAARLVAVAVGGQAGDGGRGRVAVPRGPQVRSLDGRRATDGQGLVDDGRAAEGAVRQLQGRPGRRRVDARLEAGAAGRSRGRGRRRGRGRGRGRRDRGGRGRRAAWATAWPSAPGSGRASAPGRASVPGSVPASAPGSVRRSGPRSARRSGRAVGAAVGAASARSVRRCAASAGSAPRSAPRSAPGSARRSARPWAPASAPRSAPSVGASVGAAAVGAAAVGAGLGLSQPLAACRCCLPLPSPRTMNASMATVGWPLVPSGLDRRRACPISSNVALEQDPRRPELGRPWRRPS